MDLISNWISINAITRGNAHLALTFGHDSMETFQKIMDFNSLKKFTVEKKMRMLKK